MNRSHCDRALREVRRLVSGSEPGLVDADLLATVIERRDEPAFAALVQRHGPMVLRVCHAVLGNRHDAEDAFQATFLVLAQQARSIRRHASLASWLHGVALRVARKARGAAMRRQAATAKAHAVPTDGQTPIDDLSWREVHAIVHEEPSPPRQAGWGRARCRCAHADLETLLQPAQRCPRLPGERRFGRPGR